MSSDLSRLARPAGADRTEPVRAEDDQRRIQWVVDALMERYVARSHASDRAWREILEYETAVRVSEL